MVSHKIYFCSPPCSNRYLDKYNKVDHEFIGQLWRGEKACFKNDEYDNVKLPHY